MEGRQNVWSLEDPNRSIFMFCINSIIYDYLSVQLQMHTKQPKLRTCTCLLTCHQSSRNSTSGNLSMFYCIDTSIIKLISLSLNELIYYYLFVQLTMHTQQRKLRTCTCLLTCQLSSLNSFSSNLSMFNCVDI